MVHKENKCPTFESHLELFIRRYTQTKTTLSSPAAKNNNTQASLQKKGDSLVFCNSGFLASLAKSGRKENNLEQQQ